MIIIKTKTGDSFVNELETVDVVHDKKDAQVRVFDKSGQVYHHDNVESVIYTTEAGTYENKGSRIEELEKELKDMRQRFRQLSDEYRNVDRERSELKSTMDKLQRAASTNTSKRKITLHPINPTGSDETRPYEVIGCEGMTAMSFILNVVKKDRYVSIDLELDGKPYWKGEYVDGVLKKEFENTMPDEILTIQVVSAKASGGWGQMSYKAILNKHWR